MGSEKCPNGSLSDTALFSSSLQGKTILVTGAAGSIGSTLCRLIGQLPVKQLILTDFAETPLFYINLELRKAYPDLPIHAILADIRQQKKMERIFRQWKPDIVFHAAAYKHVTLMEQQPCEAVEANVGGTRNMADMAAKYAVETFVMISTDKAVYPSCIMGATKRLAELYVLSLSSKEEMNTRFVITRFGNVLDSSGSVVPLFRQQIAEGGPVTVTHPDVCRYFMTIPDACHLVLEAVAIGKSGDLFVFDMGQPVKILDLAYDMIRESGLHPDQDIKIQFIGLQPGEKIAEELFYEEEKREPTSAQNLFRIHPTSPDSHEIQQQIDSLLEKAEAGDDQQVRKQLEETVFQLS